MKSEIVMVDNGQKRPYPIEITEQDLPLRGLPPSLEGKRFVQLSDLHSGFAHLEAAYELAIERVNTEETEFLFITGDLVDDHAKPIDYPIHQFLKRFTTKHGTYAVMGNHEQRRGIVQAKREFEKGNVRMLTNESIQLDSGLWIGGIDDLLEGKPDFDKVLSPLPTNQTSLIMAHNPTTLDRLPNRDLVLFSGHTHGGQFRIPGIPTAAMVWLHLRCRQVSGWYSNGTTRGYTNRGLGVTGRPYRINCPAEIAIFRLTSVDSPPDVL